MKASTQIKVTALTAALALAATPGLAAEVVKVYTPSGGSYYKVVQEPAYTTIYPSDYVYTAYVEPPITVYGDRLSTDQAITADVIDVIATDSRISGRVGVETQDQVVRLSGRVATPGQAYRAAIDASSVAGVKQVRNDLRTSVGGSP